MIRPPGNKSLDRQLIELAINTRRGTAEPDDTLLAYNPDAAPDDDTPVVVLATNLVDNSDFEFSRNAYFNSGAGDDDYECFGFYRQRFIKVTDVAVGSGSEILNSGSSPFLTGYFTAPPAFVLLNGGAAGEAVSGYLARVSDGRVGMYSDISLSTPILAGVDLVDAVLWFGDELAETDERALKSTDHSLYPANEGTFSMIPIWDRASGYSQLGSDDPLDTWDIATPLPLNLVRAGVKYHFRVLVSQRAGTTAGGPVRVFFGLWDGTAGQNRFLEGSNLSLAAGPVGTAGATSYNYRIIAEMDDGTEIMSDVVNVATGAATLSTSHYNRLTWQNTAGIINYKIYRETAGVVKRIFTIRNGAHDYNDYGGDEGETFVSMPSASTQRPIAYKVSSEFELAGERIWKSFLLSIEVSSTYDVSVTTGKQWLRFGIEGLAGEDRIFLMDRIMLATSDGGWQISSRDLNKVLTQNPTAAPTDDGGQGGGGIEIGCFVLDTPILICDKDGLAMQELAIGALDAKEMVGLYVFSGGNRIYRIEDAWDSVTDTLIDCSLKSGVSWTCSPSERFITSKSDRRGTRIDDLTLGDEISGWDRWRTRQSEIASYRIRKETAVVRTLKLKGGKTFCAGRLTGWRDRREKLMNAVRRALGKEERFTKAIAHNRKAVDEPT